MSSNEVENVIQNVQTQLNKIYNKLEGKYNEQI